MIAASSSRHRFAANIWYIQLPHFRSPHYGNSSVRADRFQATLATPIRPHQPPQQAASDQIGFTRRDANSYSTATIPMFWVCPSHRCPSHLAGQRRLLSKSPKLMVDHQPETARSSADQHAQKSSSSSSASSTSSTASSPSSSLTTTTWAERLQSWAKDAATSASRGAARVARQTGAAVVEGTRGVVTRLSTSVAQSSQRTVHRLAEAARSRVAAMSPLRLTSHVRDRMSNTLERAATGISGRTQAAVDHVAQTVQTTMVQPIQRNATKLGLWALLAIAVYGIASTVPREIIRHYLQQQPQQQQQPQHQHQQQQQQQPQE
jgi:hypothetical protein